MKMIGHEADGQHIHEQARAGFIDQTNKRLII